MIEFVYVYGYTILFLFLFVCVCAREICSQTHNHTEVSPLNAFNFNFCSKTFADFALTTQTTANF